MGAIYEDLPRRLRTHLGELTDRVSVIQGLTLMDGLSEETAQLPVDNNVLLRALAEADAAVADAEKMRNTIAALGAANRIPSRTMASRVRATHATVATWARENRASPARPLDGESLSIDEAS